MAYKKIKASNKKKLRRADQYEIIAALERITSFLKREDWLAKKNRYRTNTIKKIKKDTKTTNKINNKQMRDYIAISSILHYFDGWTFLAKAMNSILALDLNISRHLIYYAELRAGMSILSSHGIGIFQNKHIILESSNKNEYMTNDLQTHDMTWSALEFWFNQRKTTNNVLEIIKPNNKNLNDWLSAYNIEAYKELVGSSWLKSWGVDLRRFSQDRDARNYLSYRPTQLNPNWEIDFNILIKLVDDMWTSANFPVFRSIDLQLLRLSLVKGFELKTGKSVFANIHEYYKSIDYLIDDFAPLGMSTELWKNHLKNLRTDSIIVEKAFGKANLFSPEHFIQMFSRAFLLLRLASGFIEKNLSAAGLAMSDLKFWWHGTGQRLGYWEDDFSVEELQDYLFTDVIEAKDQLLGWYNELENPINNFIWINNMHEAKAKISQMERVAFAGF